MSVSLYLLHSVKVASLFSFHLPHSSPSVSWRNVANLERCHFHALEFTAKSFQLGTNFALVNCHCGGKQHGNQLWKADSEQWNFIACLKPSQRVCKESSVPSPCSYPTSPGLSCLPQVLKTCLGLPFCSHYYSKPKSVCLGWGWWVGERRGEWL